MIHELPTYEPGEEFGYFFEQPVQIVSARINEAPPTEADTKKGDEAMREARVTAEEAPRKPIKPRTVEEEWTAEEENTVVAE
jgi:hypothetical protein